MFFAGLASFFLAYLFFVILEEAGKDIVRIFIVSVFVIAGLAFVFVDFFYPYEATERTVITNDYEKYDLNIESDELGYIKVLEYSGSDEFLFKPKPEHTFLGFVDDVDM